MAQVIADHNNMNNFLIASDNDETLKKSLLDLGLYEK